MLKRQKTVAIFTAPQGHRSIADAASQALKNEFKVVTYFNKDSFFNLYTPIYKFIPQVWGPPFHLSSEALTRYKKLNSLSAKFFAHRYDEKLKQFYLKHKPDICINTHPFYSPSLMKLKNEFGVPFVNVVSDPRTIHRFAIAEGADINLVFDSKLSRYVKKMVPKAKVLPAGWLVKDEFEANYTKAKVRRQLGLKDVLTILISSGSDGTNLILKLIPALSLAKSPAQIVVACGHNQRMFSLIEKINELVRLKNKNVSLISLAFTPEIYYWVQASDLVVGKAGPNSLFESVATLTPFFAVTHISGQETGNLDIIRQYRLGFVEENSVKASRLLLKLINKPDFLKKFQPSLKKVANHNKLAKLRLKAVVNFLIN